VFGNADAKMLAARDAWTPLGFLLIGDVIEEQSNVGDGAGHGPTEIERGVKEESRLRRRPRQRPGSVPRRRRAKQECGWSRRFVRCDAAVAKASGERRAAEPPLEPPGIRSMVPGIADRAEVRDCCW